MSSDKELTNWVNDELHSILGLSDKYVAQFLVGLANKAKSSDDLLRRIRETETVEVNDAVAAFSNRLYDKIPRKEATPTSGGKAAPSAAVLKQWELQKKNDTYQMLEDTDDEDEEVPKKKKMKKEKKEKKREKTEKVERNVRQKKKYEESSSEDETTVKRRTHDERRGKLAEDEEEEEEEFEKEERERLEDLDERDAFAQRARDREKGNS